MIYPDKENACLELKKDLSDRFLKTVSAYANYCDGRIVFGVNDDLTISGITDEVAFRLQIENKINDSITPRPQFAMNIEYMDGKSLVILTVYKGRSAPYYYKNTAYKRTDTSTTPVDRLELRNLVLAGEELSLDELIIPKKNLSFNILEQELKREIGLEKFSEDTLRTLGLMVDGEYTRAAELLADTNTNSMSSISIVRFGKTNSVFMERKDVNHQSLLSQYHAAVDMFDKWYPAYEAVVDFRRINRIQIPREAFREGIANALVNRRYDINGSVQIAMHDDRIEIISPGGLPEGMSETTYLYRQISIPRNKIIADVFHRLHIIEKFGTGIDRIRDEYHRYPSNPSFEITADFIRIILPVINYDSTPPELTLGERIILLLAEHGTLSRVEIEIQTGFKRTRIQQELNQLINDDKIEKTGNNRGTQYRLK